MTEVWDYLDNLNFCRSCLPNIRFTTIKLAGYIVYKNNIRKKDIKGLLKFMDIFSVKRGFVVTKEMGGEELIDGKLIIFVPL